MVLQMHLEYRKKLILMKKLKLLVPTLACSVVAITPLVSMTSCGDPEPDPVDPDEPEDKTVVGYTVDQNTYRIYGLNKSGEAFELEDKQIADMEGGFLVAKADGTYLYVKDGVAFDKSTGWPKTISEWMDRAADAHAFYYEIWLLGGKYKMVEPNKECRIKFDIKGIVNNSGELTSSVDCLPDIQKTEEYAELDLGNFRDLNFTAVNIEGVKATKTGSNWSVTGAEAMSFQYCHFNGLSIFNTNYLDLYGCTLDSDCIEWAPKAGSDDFEKTQYSLWVKDVDYASFSYCHFISNGKAVKLQPTGLNDVVYVFNTCDFTIGTHGGTEKIIPHGPTDKSDQDKFAVDTNNAALWAKTEAELKFSFNVYWYGITGDISEGTHDYKHHNGKIGSLDKTQWLEESDPSAGKFVNVNIVEGELPA